MDSRTQASGRYPSNLTDAEREIAKPMIRPAKRGGRPRKVELREALNGIFLRAFDRPPVQALPKGSDQHGDGEFRRIPDDSVQVVGFSVAGEHLAIHLGADLAEVALEPFERRGIKYLAAGFGDADQANREA